MNDPIEWIGPEMAEGGAVEREFRLVRPAGAVPGVLWLPAPLSRPAGQAQQALQAQAQAQPVPRSVG